MNRDPVLIVGSDGMIGGALAASDWADRVVLETTHLPDTLSNRRIYLDMTQDILDWRPPESVSAAVLCAAISSLEQCRSNPEQTARFNVYNTIAVAKRFIDNNAFVVFISSSQVYDGSVPFQKAESKVSPQTEYGRQKAEAERQLFALGDSISVVRFTKVFGPNNPLLTGWLRALQNGETIHPFSDMTMSPIPLSFAVDVLQRVVEERVLGIIQVSATEDVTYAQVAQYIARRIGATPNLVQPIHSSNSNIVLETVPTHTTLDISRLQSTLGLEPPDVWTTINTIFGL